MAQVSFRAICNAREVLTDVPFEISYQLNNATLQSFTPPDFKGFIVQGPSMGQSISYVNGKSTSQQTRTYYLTATKAGNYSIGPAKATIENGKILNSNGIKIKVSNNRSTVNNELNNKVFIKYQINDKKTVVGQQVILDLKIYTTTNIDQFEILREPDFKQVFSHQMNRYDDATRLEVVNGIQYNTKVLKRTVLFPAESGQLIIDPTVIKIGIVKGRSNGFFNPYKMDSYTLKTDTDTINVDGLPETDLPFSGAVGNFDLFVNLDKQIIKSDEVFELELRVTGSGDIKQITAVDLGIDEQAFEVYEPNIKEEFTERNGSLGGFKFFDYVISPKYTGDFSINPRLVFYNNSQNTYETLDTLIQLKVEKGSIELPSKAEMHMAKDTSKEEILKTALSMNPPANSFRLVETPRSLFGNPMYWFFFLLPVGFYFMLPKISTTFNAGMKKVAVKKSVRLAYSNAKERLEQASALVNNNPKQACVLIQQSIHELLTEKYHLAYALTDRQRMLTWMHANKFDQLLIAETQEILSKCDQVQFGGNLQVDQVHALIDQSNQLLQKIDHAQNV